MTIMVALAQQESESISANVGSAFSSEISREKSESITIGSSDTQKMKMGHSSSSRRKLKS